MALRVGNQGPRPGVLNVATAAARRGALGQAAVISPVQEAAIAAAKQELRRKIEEKWNERFRGPTGIGAIPELGRNLFQPLISMIELVPDAFPQKNTMIATLQDLEAKMFDSNPTAEKKAEFRRIISILITNLTTLKNITRFLNIFGGNSTEKLDSFIAFLNDIQTLTEAYWLAVGSRAAGTAAAAAAFNTSRPNANVRGTAISGMDIVAMLNSIQSHRDIIAQEYAEQAARELPVLRAEDTQNQKRQKEREINAISRRRRILRSILQFYDTTVLSDVNFLTSILGSSDYDISNSDMLKISEKVREIQALSQKYANYSRLTADLSTQLLPPNAGANAGKQVGKAWIALSTDFSTKLKDLKDLVDIASSDMTTIDTNMSFSDNERSRATRIKLFDRSLNLLQKDTGNANYQTLEQVNENTQDMDWFRDAQAKSCERIVSSCRGQKSFLLLHAVGSGKSRTALCVAMNTHPSLPIVCLTIKGLETAFLDELAKDFLNEDVRKSLERRITFVSYDTLDQMARNLRLNPYDTSYESIFKNAVVLADEAHRLYPILEATPSKSDTTPYEMEVVEILKTSFKVILMTATPIQKSWADFGRMINLMINLNNPFKQISVNTNGSFRETDTFVKLIPADDEVNFRRNFIEDKGVLSTGVTAVYTLVFKLRKKFDERITNLAAVFGIVANPDSIVRVVDKIINLGGYASWHVNLTSYVPIASATGGLIPMTMSVAQSAIYTVVAYQSIASILNYVDNTFLDKIMNPPYEPMDLNALVLRTLPYISFSDYKADEITHELLVKEYNRLQGWKVNPFANRSVRKGEILNNIWKIEVKLKDFPVLNKKEYEVPYSALQRGMWHFLTQKGLTPSIGERHVANLIEINLNPKNGVITFGKPITTSETEDLTAALRCLGNISEDNFFLDTKLIDDSDKRTMMRRLQISEDTFNRFIANGCYVATEKDLRIIEMYLPDDFKQTFREQNATIPGRTKLEKLAEVYGLNERRNLWNLNDSQGNPIPYHAFQCYKYDRALSLIIEARLKFNYLPVVYSNFEKRGMETFSAFLTSHGFNHIVLHKDIPLQLRQARIQEAQKVYEKSTFSLGRFKGETILQTEITKSIGENRNMGWPELTLEENTRLIREILQLNNEPMCVLVHPDFQEGLDLKFNEVMICLEPMLGVGNQEQVYGRIMRSIDKKDYQEYYDTYKVNPLSVPPSSDEKIAAMKRYLNSHWLNTAVVNSQRILVVKEEVYKEMLDHARAPEIPNDKRDTRKRINKYVFQLVSDYYTKRNPDPEMYYDPELRNWRIWSCLPILGTIGQGVASQIDSLVNLTYKNPRRIFLDPVAEYESIRGAVRVNDPGIIAWLNNMRRSFWYNQMPYIDYKFIYSYIFRLPVDIVRFGEGIVQASTFRKGEGISQATKGSVEEDIRFPTSDLYYMSKIKTVELEYKQMRTAFRLVGDDNIEKLYEIGPYDGACDRGTQYYLDEFKRPDSKCKLLTGKSYTRKNVCSKVGPQLQRYTELRRGRRNSPPTRRKLLFTPKMINYLSPPGTPGTPGSVQTDDPTALNLGAAAPAANAARVAAPAANAARVAAPAANAARAAWDAEWDAAPEWSAAANAARAAPEAPAQVAQGRLANAAAEWAAAPRVIRRPRPLGAVRRLPGQVQFNNLQVGGGEEEMEFTSDPVPNPVNVEEIKASPILTPDEKEHAIEDAERIKKEYIEGVQRFIQYFKANPQLLKNSKVSNLFNGNPLSAINTSLFQTGGKKRRTHRNKYHRKHQSRKRKH